jgi:thiol-disulfide isomerase/thioredoxin
MNHTSRRGLLIILGLAVAQGGAYAAYRVVERARAPAESDARFSVDAASGPAPDIEMVQADGSKVRLSDFRGKVVIVHFWATWCAPCARELPGLLKFAERDDLKGVTVRAVSLDDGWSNVRTFLGPEIPNAVVRGATGTEGRAYGVGILPQTFVVGTRGELLLHAVGARDWTSRGAADMVLSARATEGANK